MNIVDTTYLVFGQAMPKLDGNVRMDVVDWINEGEFGVALDALLRAIDADGISVDGPLLDSARFLADHAGLASA